MNSDEVWRIRSRVPFHTYKAQQKISRVRRVHTSWRYSDTLGEGWRLGGACGREDGTKSMQWKSQCFVYNTTQDCGGGFRLFDSLQ